MCSSLSHPVPVLSLVVAGLVAMAGSTERPSMGELSVAWKTKDFPRFLTWDLDDRQFIVPTVYWWFMVKNGFIIYHIQFPRVDLRLNTVCTEKFLEREAYWLYPPGF